MHRFTLFTSNTTGNAKNSNFPNKAVITDKQSLAQTVKYDHVMAE